MPLPKGMNEQMTDSMNLSETTHPITYIVQKIHIHLMYPSRYGIPNWQFGVQRECI